MFEIIQHTGDGAHYPLDYPNTKLVQPFEKLREALDYWKRNNLCGSDGYFLVVNVPGVRPTAMRLEKGHFV